MDPCKIQALIAAHSRAVLNREKFAAMCRKHNWQGGPIAACERAADLADALMERIMNHQDFGTLG